MKRLDELGVSPAPWKAYTNEDFDSNDEVRDENDELILCDAPHANARLIAAAPELYEALRLVLETIDALGFKPVVESDPLALAVKCGEKALEKAGGVK